jgi:hypothetical protein
MTPLQYGTLVPGEDTYPNTPQVLLQRFAGNLFVPEQPQQFYNLSAPDTVPTNALWLDSRNGALKVNKSLTWVNILGGNSAFRTAPNNGAILAGTNIFNKSASPASDRGTEVANLSFSPRAVGNRVLVVAQVPAITSSENDVTAFAMLNAGSTPIALSAALCRAGVLTSLFLMGLHLPSVSEVTSGLTYSLRIGTDSPTSALYFNRTAGTDAFGNFLNVQIVATELPVN